MATTSFQSFDDVERVLDKMDYLLERGSFANAFELISENLEEQHGGMFTRGQDADGNRWAPLAPSTIAKKGHGTILVDKGDLMNSLVGNNQNAIRDIYDREMHFGTSDPKAIYHDQGTRKMPARPPVGISEETLDQAAEHCADRAVELALEALK